MYCNGGRLEFSAFWLGRLLARDSGPTSASERLGGTIDRSSFFVDKLSVKNFRFSFLYAFCSFFVSWETPHFFL